MFVTGSSAGSFSRTSLRSPDYVAIEGRGAVISGGTSGIGLAIAQRFVKGGAHVFIFGRRRNAFDEAEQLACRSRPSLARS